MVDVLRNHYKTTGENYVLNSDPPIYTQVVVWGISFTLNQTFGWLLVPKH